MTDVEDAIRVGADAVKVSAAGVAFGRNVFQAKTPTFLIKRLCTVVHNGYTAEEAEKVVL